MRYKEITGNITNMWCQPLVKNAHTIKIYFLARNFYLACNSPQGIEIFYSAYLGPCNALRHTRTKLCPQFNTSIHDASETSFSIAGAFPQNFDEELPLVS